MNKYVVPIGMSVLILALALAVGAAMTFLY